MKPSIDHKHIDEFYKFYNEVDSFYKGKIMTSLERETVKELKKYIKQSSEFGLDCTTLSRFESRIAVLLMTLGELVSERVKQANFAFRYNKWKKHKEWNKAKTELQNGIGKVLVGDIENETNARMFIDVSLETYIQGLADYLMAIHKDGHVFLNSIKDRIKSELRDYNQKGTPE